MKALSDVFVPFMTDLGEHIWKVCLKFHRFVEQVEAQCVGEDGEKSVENKDERDENKEAEPEPEDEVDFPIDDVLKKRER